MSIGEYLQKRAGRTSTPAHILARAFEQTAKAAFDETDGSAIGTALQELKFRRSVYNASFGVGIEIIFNALSLWKSKLAQQSILTKFQHPRIFSSYDALRTLKRYEGPARRSTVFHPRDLGVLIDGGVSSNIIMNLIKDCDRLLPNPDDAVEFLLDVLEKRWNGTGSDDPELTRIVLNKLEKFGIDNNAGSRRVRMLEARFGELVGAMARTKPLPNNATDNALELFNLAESMRSIAPSSANMLLTRWEKDILGAISESDFMKHGITQRWLLSATFALAEDKLQQFKTILRAPVHRIIKIGTAVSIVMMANRGKLDDRATYNNCVDYLIDRSERSKTAEALLAIRGVYLSGHYHLALPFFRKLLRSKYPQARYAGIVEIGGILHLGIGNEMSPYAPAFISASQKVAENDPDDRIRYSAEQLSINLIAAVKQRTATLCDELVRNPEDAELATENLDELASYGALAKDALPLLVMFAMGSRAEMYPAFPQTQLINTIRVIG